MYLKDLINWLEQQNPDTVVKDGFGYPHTDRGYYKDLVFDPVPETTFGAMLKYAKKAKNKSYPGYKGGMFKKHEFTTCRIGVFGICGEEICSAHLKVWLLTAK